MLRFLTIMITTLWMTGAAYDAELFVSPQGDNANPGTLDRPFKTLAQAGRAPVRTLKTANQGEMPVGGVTVWLREGRYELAETFVLGPEDSGQEGRPVAYRSYEKERPVLSGGRAIRGWKKVEGDLPGLPKAAQGKVWVAGVPEAAEGKWSFRQLWANGKQLTRGTVAERWRDPLPGRQCLSAQRRCPQSGSGPGPLGGRSEAGVAHGPVPQRGLEGIPRRQAAQRLGQQECGSLRHHRRTMGYHANPDQEGRRAAIDHGGALGLLHLLLGRDEHDGRRHQRGGHGTYRKCLVAPRCRGRVVSGLRRRAGLLPPRRGRGSQRGRVRSRPAWSNCSAFAGRAGSPSSSSKCGACGWSTPRGGCRISATARCSTAFTVRRPSPLFTPAPCVSGSLRPKDEYPEFCLPAAVDLMYARQCLLELCRVGRVGATAIGLAEGCRDNRVAGCEAFEAGGHGIHVGSAHGPICGEDFGWKRPDDEPWANEISNCHVHHTGEMDWGAAGILSSFCRKTRISHNLVEYVPYGGIAGCITCFAFLPGREEEVMIEYNHVHHTSQKLTDTGGIYTEGLGSKPATLSVIRGNLIHDVPRDAWGANRNNGIFLDNRSWGVRLEDNIIYGTVDIPIRFNTCTREAILLGDELFGSEGLSPRIRGESGACGTLQESPGGTLRPSVSQNRIGPGKLHYETVRIFSSRQASAWLPRPQGQVQARLVKLYALRNAPRYDRILKAKFRRSPSFLRRSPPPPQASGTAGTQNSGNFRFFLTYWQFESQDCASPLMTIAHTSARASSSARRAVAKCVGLDAAPRPAWRTESAAVHRGEAAMRGPRVSVSSLLDT